jgi:hypothetical protein
MPRTVAWGSCREALSLGQHTSPQNQLRKRTISTNTLLLHPIIKPQISNTNHHPPNQSCNRSNIHKPRKNHTRPRTYHHIHQWTRHHTQRDRIPRRPEAITLHEDSGCVSVGAETVESTRCEEDAGRAGGDSRGADYSVDD